MSSDSNIGGFEKQTLGLLKTLEKRQEICDVEVSHNPPVSKAAVTSWEKEHSCIIPEDLNSFYRVMNGLLLTWNVKMNDMNIPVGRLVINSIEQLKKLTVGVAGSSAVNDLHLDDDNDSESSSPKFDHRSRIFELDSCNGFGKVCLVYRNTKPGLPAQNADIWFVDRALQWYYLAESFIFYYRMMFVHLGLPQWQYAFTDVGLSYSAMQWFNMFCPLRLEVDTRDASSSSVDVNASSNRPSAQLDISKVFKGKTDKKKPAAQIVANASVKRKPTFAATKPSSGKIPISFIQPNKLNIR